MTRAKRTFTPEDRLSLLQEAERDGFAEVSRKHSLSAAKMYGWKKRYLAKGAEGLKPAYKRVDPKVRELEEENERLKRIVARMAMELEVKTELLKKTPIQSKKNGR